MERIGAVGIRLEARNQPVAKASDPPCPGVERCAATAPAAADMPQGEDPIPALAKTLDRPDKIFPALIDGGAVLLSRRRTGVDGPFQSGPHRNDHRVVREDRPELVAV